MNNITEGLEFVYGLIESTPQGILAFDVEGYVTLINKNAIAQLGLKGSTSFFLEKKVTDIIPNKHLKKKINEVLSSGRENFELEALKVKKKYLNIYAKKSTSGMIVFINNVSDIINGSHRDLANLLKGQEIERKRLSKEFHDGLGPNLSTVKLSLDSLKKKMTVPDNIKILNAISEQVSDIATEIRDISHNLMPSSILEFGIVTAINNLSSRLSSQSDIDVEVDISFTDEDPALTVAKVLNIYRIVQECIQNGIKHGGATKFWIRCSVDEEILNLSISNNGEINEAKAISGLGLNNMKSRAGIMKGSFRLRVNALELMEAELRIPIH